MDKFKTSFAKIDKLTIKDIKNIQKIINSAYKIAENDLWIESAQRVSPDELKDLIKQNKIIIVKSDDLILGSIKVIKFSQNIAEFGMLATDLNYRGFGLGNKLVTAAENWARDNNFKIMRLELLTPKHHTSQSKEKLKKWYTKCGYKHYCIEPFADLFPDSYHLLAVECDFNVYHKTL
ncbi:hypothetical protein fh0823_03650 [Francisella halioticida]|uniref:GNAT family N-acetyltransferase n=1 Tax=Francisella halioticida TaxID=549298 RepID=UPI001AFA6105|nr:GNAT family N-acetyltransferase [Francisella halioticida]BCD90226.1 hypothetical protein fh0823_03650 [Francisella halioticida]